VYWIVLLMTVVVTILSVVAWRMWRKVFEQKNKAKQHGESALKDEHDRTDYIVESINIIASSLLSDQVRIAEGSIRMAVLMDNLPLTCDAKHQFKAIFEVHEKTSHIPTHEKWKALSKSERKQFEKELKALESRYKESIFAAAEIIKQKPFSRDRYVKQA